MHPVRLIAPNCWRVFMRRREASQSYREQQPSPRCGVPFQCCGHLGKQQGYPPSYGCWSACTWCSFGSGRGFRDCSCQKPEPLQMARRRHEFRERLDPSVGGIRFSSAMLSFRRERCQPRVHTLVQKIFAYTPPQLPGASFAPKMQSNPGFALRLARHRVCHPT